MRFLLYIIQRNREKVNRAAQISSACSAKYLSFRPPAARTRPCRAFRSRISLPRRFPPGCFSLRISGVAISAVLCYNRVDFLFQDGGVSHGRAAAPRRAGRLSGAGGAAGFRRGPGGPLWGQPANHSGRHRPASGRRPGGLRHAPGVSSAPGAHRPSAHCGLPPRPRRYGPGAGNHGGQRLCGGGRGGGAPGVRPADGPAAPGLPL